jgi:DNA-binding XRE family transcriptional regulator
MMDSLDEQVHENIKFLCTEGDALAERGDYEGALAKDETAWVLLPEPSVKWEAATWILAAMRAKDPAFRAEFDRLQLARKVKGLREKKKMSQVQLAALAGTKQPNIARLESGKVVPKLDFLEKVARALGGHLDVRIVEGKSNA